ncbi:hypothetical protein CHS0354_032276 [Potamilus streckersoni]|uniref:Uncharacterized protein n=1 Tax=Potamilus streckersoni TaxID=2493646 RepID=A0AAE0RQ26_9BIVA|nr:hypothetical protein CHS0354_032276 [Potamilus streckersoni]
MAFRMFVLLGVCAYCTSSKEPRFFLTSAAQSLANSNRKLLNISESYNVDKSQVSVSGISSGACFATQFHVIHSAQIMGVGIIAGGRYTDETCSAFSVKK